MAVHRRKHTVADMLDGQIHVLANAVVVADLRDQLVGDLVGIEIEQSDPRDRGLLADGADQLGEHVLAVEVQTVARGVLRDEVQLLDADRLQLLGLADDVLDGAGAHFAADEGNGAVGATVVTALGDLQVRGVLRRGEDALAAERGAFLILEGGVFFASCHRLDRLGDLVVGAGAEHGVHLGHFSEDLLAVALGEAAAGDDALERAVLFQPRNVENVLDRLLLGALDKAAGVDDDDVCHRLVGRDLVALVGEYF